MGATVLNSWKEIAEYVGRGVRTVERWERELGLPVHRPRNHLRSPVIAIPTEIDQWLQCGGPRKPRANGDLATRAEMRRLRAELTTGVGRVRQNVALMRQRVEEMMQNGNVSARNNGTRAVPKA